MIEDLNREPRAKIYINDCTMQECLEILEKLNKVKSLNSIKFNIEGTTVFPYDVDEEED